MFLSYPLLSQHRDEAGKRTIETGEIREGDIGADLRIDPLNERKKHNSGSKVRFVTDRFVILWA